MDLPIAAFEIMVGIAEDNKVKSIKWAKASGLSPSRVSDFKRLTTQTKAGAAEPDQGHDAWRHTFSLNNFFALWDGLKRLVGATELRRGLTRRLRGKNTPSTRVRIFLRVVTFNDGQLKLVDAFTDAVLQQVHISTKRNYR